MAPGVGDVAVKVGESTKRSNTAWRKNLRDVQECMCGSFKIGSLLMEALATVAVEIVARSRRYPIGIRVIGCGRL